MTRNYFVEFEGHLFTRRTDRVYTHVVIGSYTGSRPEFPYMELGFCGSHELAMKKASSEAKHRQQVLILPVQEIGTKEFKALISAHNAEALKIMKEG